MFLVTPKAGAKHELLVNKPTFDRTSSLFFKTTEVNLLNI
jgi:hypothetical protein